MSSGQGPIGDALANGMHVTRGVRGATCEIVRARAQVDQICGSSEKTHLGYVTGCRTSQASVRVDASRCVRVMQISRDRKVRSIVTPGTAPTFVA